MSTLNYVSENLDSANRYICHHPTMTYIYTICVEQVERTHKNYNGEVDKPCDDEVDAHTNHISKMWIYWGLLVYLCKRDKDIIIFSNFIIRSHHTCNYFLFNMLIYKGSSFTSLCLHLSSIKVVLRTSFDLKLNCHAITIRWFGTFFWVFLTHASNYLCDFNDFTYIVQTRN